MQSHQMDQAVEIRTAIEISTEPLRTDAGYNWDALADEHFLHSSSDSSVELVNLLECSRLFAVIVMSSGRPCQHNPSGLG